MAKASYWELLKHPKWQEKRLRIMERSEFRCDWCEDEGTTLHVHHTHYVKGAKPWEYPDSELLCLCAPCHERADYLRAEIAGLAGIATAHSEENAERILGYISAMLAQIDAGEEPRAGWLEIGSAGEVAGVADFFGVNETAVMNQMEGKGADYHALIALDPRRNHSAPAN